MTRRTYFLTILSAILAFSILSSMPASPMGVANVAATSSASSWNPLVPCTPLMVRITDITANQTGLSSFNASRFSPGITTSVTNGEAKRWLTPGRTPPGWVSPGPLCTLTNSKGTTSLFVQINGLERSGLTNEDFATSYDTTNGGTAHASTGDTTFNLFDPAVVPQYSTSCKSPTDPTCYGEIHAEIDHDWKAAGYCGTGTFCDNTTLASQTSATSTKIDVQGFIYWDPDNLNATWHQFSGWEIHPMTAWKLSASVNFSWSPTNPQVGQPATFNATSSNGTSPLSFNWDFGDGVTASGRSTSHMYIAAGPFTVHATMTGADGTTVATEKVVPVGSWNPAVVCAPAATRLESVIGNISIQRISTNPNSTGADYSGGGFRLDGSLPYGSNPVTWPFFKRDLKPPCTVNGTPTFVEFHNVTVTGFSRGDCSTTYSIDNGGGSYPNGWQSCDTTFNLVTPGFGDDSTCPRCYMHRVYAGIDRDWNASGVAPLPAPVDGQRIDLQGFVYWNNVFINASWHSYSGWETHPLTAWRPARPPVTAHASFSPSNPTTAQTVSFSGTSSGGTGPYTFTWDFGDGAIATGNSASHAYALGTYAVHMAATDSFGTVGVATVTVKVTDAPPTVSFTESASNAFRDQPVTLTVSSFDPDGTVTSIRVSWGDGTVDLLAGTATTDSHAYVKSGTFTINVTATDNGGITASATAGITITDAPPTVSFTATPTTANTGQTITLTISSKDTDGTITQTVVNWGDGTVHTLAGAATTDIHAYPNTGNAKTQTFTVLVTVTDNATLTGTNSVLVTINDLPPTPSFTRSSMSASTGVTITFDATASGDPDGTITGYSWAFGDGGTATGVIVSHSYANTGSAKTLNYTVTLTVTDNSGNTGLAQSFETITDRPPTASFTTSTTSALTGVSITFNATASSDPDGTITSYSWSFGDGGTGAGPVLTHSYASTGSAKTENFTVTLTVTDNSGNTATAMFTETITDRGPVASFTASTTSTLTGVSITFNATASSDPDGTITGYSWAFGDGSTATGAVVSHSYASTGNAKTATFTVTLTVTDNSGNTGNAQAVETIADRGPTASFTESTMSALTGVSITFNATASSDPDGTIASYSWTFGDGTTGNGAIVTHNYANTGSAKALNYTVSLTVTDNSGNTGTALSAETITDRPPVASFSQLTPSALTGVSITFNATASSDPDGTVASYSWAFGDGSTGTGPAVTHSYANTGGPQTAVFTVTLTVTDNSGNTGTAQSAETITDRSPTVSFTSSLASVLTGVNVTLNATGSSDPDGIISSYSWAFGDGGTATGLVVSHSYANTGSAKALNYTVTLTVTDNSGNTGTAQSAETITDRPPTASFTESTTSALTGVSITFNATASSDPDGTITSYTWTFGDGSNGTGAVVTHSYASTGSAKTENFTVTLTVTDNSGSTGTAQATETVNDRSPTAFFAESAASALTGVSVTFNATGSSDPDGTISTYSWAFGDGGTATGMIVTHSYASTGSSVSQVFTVTLTVTDNSGNNDVVSSPETINDRFPVASFATSTQSALTMVGVSLNATASIDPDGTISSYAWNFGDGSTGIGVTVSHSYANTGNSMTENFTVTLTVTDNGGSIGTVTSLVTITDRPPIASFTASLATTYTGVGIGFNATASGDPDGSITAYSWSFGDGSAGSGMTISHSFVAAGNYTVALTVSDNSGNQVSSTFTETILDRPPVVFFSSSSPTSLTLNSVGFNATGSFDPDGTIVGYGWNFGDGSTASGITTAHAYAKAGNYTVVLAVTDNSGLVSFRSLVETILDRAPTASFVYFPASPLTGQTINYDATSSSDPDGTIASFAWNFGDNATGTGASVQHSYATNGTFTVFLTVTDDNGSKATTSTAITVGVDPAPVFPQGSSLKASNIGPRSLTLTWTPANDSVQVTTYRVYVNGTLLVTLTGSLTSYTVTGLSPLAHYLFQVQAGNPSGNYSNNGPFTQAFTRLQGDVNLDCKVDILDLTVVALSFGSRQGSATYNPKADLNGDGVINIMDLVLVGANFGQVC